MTRLIKSAAEGEQPAPPLIVPQWESATWQPTGEAGRFGPAEKNRAGQRRAHQGQNQLPWTRAEPTWTRPADHTLTVHVSWFCEDHQTSC